MGGQFLYLEHLMPKPFCKKTRPDYVCSAFFDFFKRAHRKAGV